MVCPHCNQRGYLICHGFLTGYEEDSSNSIQRGRRLFCNNRSTNTNGCGRTFSILYAGFIKYRTLTAFSFWKALLNIVNGIPVYRAFKGYGPDSTSNAPYGIMKKFRENQSRIRTALYGKSPPEDSADNGPDLNYFRSEIISSKWKTYTQPYTACCGQVKTDT